MLLFKKFRHREGDMFENCEHGIVRWVPRVIREGKHFGFVRCADGESIFLPFNGGMTLFSDGTWQKKTERNPKPGDRIIFRRGENHRGVCISSWAYIANLEKAHEGEITTRTYRVMRATSFASREGLFISPAPEWEGDSLEDLAQEHPRTGTSMDDFRLYETPSFSTRGIFQAENAPDEWIEISDPRPLIHAPDRRLGTAA